MEDILPNTIRALLFDLGGVIIDIDFNRVFDYWANHADRSASEIRSNFSFDHYYEAHEKGEIETAEYFEHLRRILKLEISDDQLEEGWNSIFIGEMPGIYELLNQFKDKLPLYAFTNSNHLHQKVWSVRFSKVLNFFQSIFNSAEIGLRKPDPEAFLKVAELMSLKPNQILFYDDSMANILGAKRAGFRAVHIRAACDIVDSINDHFAMNFKP